jgi:hypothetical protein
MMVLEQRLFLLIVDYGRDVRWCFLYIQIRVIARREV